MRLDPGAVARLAESPECADAHWNPAGGPTYIDVSISDIERRQNTNDSL